MTLVIAIHATQEGQPVAKQVAAQWQNGEDWHGQRWQAQRGELPTRIESATRKERAKNVERTQPATCDTSRQMISEAFGFAPNLSTSGLWSLWVEPVHDAVSGTGATMATGGPYLDSTWHFWLTKKGLRGFLLFSSQICTGMITQSQVTGVLDPHWHQRKACW